MKLIHLIALLLLIPFSALAGTFLETFDDRNLEDWQELVQLNNAPGSWEIVDDELHAVSRETFLRLLTTGDDTWEDYTVKFDVKPLKNTVLERYCKCERFPTPILPSNQANPDSEIRCQNIYIP